MIFPNPLIYGPSSSDISCFSCSCEDKGWKAVCCNSFSLTLRFFKNFGFGECILVRSKKRGEGGTHLAKNFGVTDHICFAKNLLVGLKQELDLKSAPYVLVIVT